MSAISLLGIEEKLRNSDPEKRQNTLWALTDLFLSAAPQLDEDGVEVFDNVDTLTNISVRMAPVPNAPSRLIRRFANDSEIAVAGPVLSQSPRLSETDLARLPAPRATRTCWRSPRAGI